MTRKVVTVRPGTPFTEIVRLLNEHQISGVPVVSPDGRIIGMVSETDLLAKEEFKASGLQEVPEFESRPARRMRAKAAGITAAEVMSTPVIAVTMNTSIVEAARQLSLRRINRLPVTDLHGRPVGIIARSDLLKVFLRPDEEIREEIQRSVFGHYLRLDVSLVHVEVDEGVVSLSGKLPLRSLVPVALRLSSAVEGVARVVDDLGWDRDDMIATPGVPD